ncbi:MAG: hypothetical protein KJO31_15965 [Gammaproteobacteria bacterium]|nr:hypothetical protein [Gammaproteobacteria bacterium]
MQTPQPCRANYSPEFDIPRWRRRFAVLALLICTGVSANDELKVQNPQQIAYNVGGMTDAAIELGLDEQRVSMWLAQSLQHAGLAARAADTERDQEVVFLDIVVEAGSYYASVGFWRNASYDLPDGTEASNQVIVWQEYAIGSHNGDVDQLRHTVNRVIERFVSSYGNANDLDLSQQVAATR